MLPSPYCPHRHSTHSRVCLRRPSASALTRELDLGGPVYSRVTSHQVQWSRDTCLGHDGVSSMLHSRPRGAAFRLSQPSVARTYHSGQHNLASILVFLFWAVDAPKCNSGLEVVVRPVRLSSLRKQTIVQPFAQFWIRLISSETPRHAVALIIIHSNSSRFHESLFCAAGDYHATSRQFSETLGRTAKTHAGTILRSAARPERTCRINVGKPHEWDMSCTSSHVAVAHQPQLAVQHEASTAWFLSGRGLESCPRSVEEHRQTRHAEN